MTDYEARELFGRWLREKLRERHGRRWRRKVGPVVGPYAVDKRQRSEEEAEAFLERLMEYVKELDTPKRKRQK